MVQTFYCTCRLERMTVHSSKRAPNWRHRFLNNISYPNIWTETVQFSKIGNARKQNNVKSQNKKIISFKTAQFHSNTQQRWQHHGGAVHSKQIIDICGDGCCCCNTVWLARQIAIFWWIITPYAFSRRLEFNLHLILEAIWKYLKSLIFLSHESSVFVA